MASTSERLTFEDKLFALMNFFFLFHGSHFEIIELTNFDPYSSTILQVTDLHFSPEPNKIAWESRAFAALFSLPNLQQ